MEHQPIYKYDADYARQNDELALYRDSNRLNTACADAIDIAVKDSNYALYRYDLSAAAHKVIAEYGPERVSWVLAATLQNLAYDGRFSHDNKSWGNGFSIPNDKSIHYTVKTHPYVLDGFIDEARKVFAELEQDTADKIAMDYHALLEEFDPYGYRDVYEFGHLNVTEVSMFDVKSVQKAIKQDAKAITKGGMDFDTIVEVVSTLVTDCSNDPNDRYMLEFAEQAQSLLDRLTAYGEEHHRKPKKVARKVEEKGSVLNQLKEGKKTGLRDKKTPKNAPKRNNEREV